MIYLGKVREAVAKLKNLPQNHSPMDAYWPQERILEEYAKVDGMSLEEFIQMATSEWR